MKNIYLFLATLIATGLMSACAITTDMANMSNGMYRFKAIPFDNTTRAEFCEGTPASGTYQCKNVDITFE